MNNIKFRAWDIKKCIRVNDFFITPKGDLLCSDYLDLNLNDELELMQYTDLKDKNGIEIYEKDILKSPKGILWIVSQHKSGTWVVSKLPTPATECFSLEDLNPIWMEIIGNIYDNPELLEK